MTSLKTALCLLLAASIATAGPTGPLSVPQTSQAELDSVLAATWTKVKPYLDAELQKEVQKLSGSTHGSLVINTLSLASYDTSAPPRLVITPIVTGQHHFLFFTWGTPQYGGEDVKLLVPNGSWSVQLKGHVTYSQKILFFTLHLSQDVTITVSGLNASEDLQLDTSNPSWPVCKGAGNLQVNYSLDVKTGNTGLNILLTLLKPLVDYLVRQQVNKALSKIDAEIAGLVGAPANPPWGTGAPARAPFGQQPDLEQAALAASADMQTTHTPYGGVLSAHMTLPTYGQGTPDHWLGFGDSAIWTGHYLAGESFRYACTQDPQAKANATRAIAAITDMFDVETPGGGHLARCAVPVTAPDAATLQTDPHAFTSTLRGQSVVCLGDISRDQYLGVMHGLGCAWDFIGDPATQQAAGALEGRVVDYLVANGWVAMQHDNVTMSAPFVQSPDKMIAFTALAAHANPSYQALRDQVGQLAWVLWVFDEDGALDPLSSYYKWNLGEGTDYHAVRLETDPSRYQAIARHRAIVRTAIGHHENAYFQTIDTALDSTLAPTLAPEILDELRRFVSRGRRDFPVTNSTDPTIQKGSYSVPLSFQKTSSGSATLTPTTIVEALYPIAVEKRPSTDFLWQRDPFQLDGGGDPQQQEPGVDIVLPYWMARYYKLVP